MLKLFAAVVLAKWIVVAVAIIIILALVLLFARRGAP